MGTRGDKRRAKAKRRRPRRPDIEGFQAGPLTVERHGKVVVSRVDPDHPGYAEFREGIEAMTQQLPQEAERLRSEIRALVEPFDAFDVVTNLWLMNLPRNPETYRESTEPGLLAIPEVAAAILLERPSRKGADPHSHIAPALQEAQEKLREFLRAQSFAYMDEARRRDPDDPAYAEIRGTARAHRLAVRGPSYPWQENQTLLDLFDADESRDLVRQAAGFSAREGAALAEATVQFGLDRLAVRAREARAFAERLLDDDDPDSAVFLVEVKASSMRPSARRAAPEALRDWLEDELSKAGHQARRAREALFGESTPRVFDARGRPLQLDLDGVEHVIEMVVTLEDLPAIAPQTWKLADAGILPDDPVPWAVSLHELEIICDIVERPVELVHYALRRQRLSRQRRVWAMDELDYFMHYLMSGLYWPDASGDPHGPIQLLSHTDELDAYYAHLRGERRKAAKRPGQKHAKAVRALLDCLGGLDNQGRLDASLAILEVNVESRERIAGDLRRLRMQSARDRMAHDRSYFFDDFGITVVSVPPAEHESLPERLHVYCMLKKHQMKVARWVGFGVFQGPPEPAQVAVVFSGGWEPDEELARLVAELPSFGVEGDFDGRKLISKRSVPSLAGGGARKKPGSRVIR